MMRHRSGRRSKFRANGAQITGRTRQMTRAGADTDVWGEQGEQDGGLGHRTSISRVCWSDARLVLEGVVRYGPGYKLAVP